MGRGEETVTTHELAVSNMLSIEAMMRVLVRKGFVTEKELLDEVRAVQVEMGQRQHRAPETEQ